MCTTLQSISSLRWNFVRRDKYKRDDRFDWLELRGRQGEDENLAGVQRPKHPVGDYIVHPVTALETKNLENRGTVRAQLVRSSADWSSGILTDHSIQNASCEVIRNAQHYVYIENQFFITATGDQQSPIHNTIGRAIVDAVVRAAKEQRKFRVIILIPAIPGFAGDLKMMRRRERGPSWTTSIKSICRGEHSIFEQIRKEGVDPTKHIFLFNLRSYDRLDKTPAMKRQEEESGVKYQEVQRAEAEEIMGEGIHGNIDVEGGRDAHMGEKHEQRSAVKGELAENTAEERKDDADERRTDAKRKFEAARRTISRPSLARALLHHAMAGTGPLSETKWEGSDEDEVENWIQEELYIHAKLLIADDRIVICGSSNLNDRSQLGYHDSELSIVVEDTKRFPSMMDGQTIRGWLARWDAPATPVASTPGLLLPRKMTPVKDPNAQPPAGDSPNDPWDRDESWKTDRGPSERAELWDMWTGQATKNTEMFRQLFHADPDDHG